MFKLQKLGPVHDFVFVSSFEGITLEREGFLKVGKLLIADARGLAQRTGRSL